MKSFKETGAMLSAQSNTAVSQRRQGAVLSCLSALGLDYLVVVSPCILISLPL